MKRLIFTLISLFLFSTSGVKAQSGESFPYVTLPYYLAADDGNVAKEWLALHFWNDYDFGAWESKYAPEANKQGFLTFAFSLHPLLPEISAKAIATMMDKAAVSEEGYWYFLEMAEESLYNPSSPMRNDLLWESFVRHAIGESSPLDEPSKGRYRSLLKLVIRNQKGSVATDFTYTLPNGEQANLHAINAPYTVIFFYNPECGECARTKAQILASGHLETLHQKGLVEVLALHPDGNISEWRKALPENPEWWISAYDKEQKINNEGLYDLKAIPTLYLLDAQKRVVMKDPAVEAFISFLASASCW